MNVVVFLFFIVFVNFFYKYSVAVRCWLRYHEEMQLFRAFVFDVMHRVRLHPNSFLFLHALRFIVQVKNRLAFEHKKELLSLCVKMRPFACVRRHSFLLHG